MVSRRSTQSITQRSTRQSELHMARRPRRLVPPKTMDDTVGLSRKEERELKKALYASLQMTRRNRNPQSEAEDSNISEEPPSKLRKSTRNISANSSYLSASSSYASLKETMTTSQSTVDESSQDSVMSYAGSACESKKKIHAQRKFAQGCSLPSTPSTTPNKKAPNSPHNLLNRVPKTEDFLTFLCLRGSHILPPHLDFFNFSRDGASVEESSSNPRTPVSADQPIKTEEAREGTPESSSSSSNTNEELREISNFALAQRKAARASAGTPETARGIVSLRQGLTRKVAHSGGTPPSQHSKQYFFDPEKTPSPTGSRLLLGDITPAKKSASIKCLPSSFLRFSPLGKLVLERQGNQPLIMSKCSLQPSPLSIDKAQAQAKRLAQDSKIAEPVEAMVDFEIPFKGGNSDIAKLSDTLVNQEMPFKTIDSKLGKPSQDSDDYETSIKPTRGTSDLEKSLDAMAKSEMPFEMISATKLHKSLVNQEEFCKVALENLDNEKLFETVGNLEIPLEAIWEHSDTDNAATCVKPFLVINENIDNVATCVKPFTVIYKSTDNVATCVKPTVIPESTDIANRTEPLTTYEQNFEVAFKNSDDAKISETIANHVILLTVNHGHSDITHEPVANHRISLNTLCCISDIVNKSTSRHEVLIIGKHDNSDVDELMAIQEAPLNTPCSSSEIIDEFTTSHEIPLTILQGSSISANELSLTIQQGSEGIADEIPLTIQQGSVGIADEIPLTIQQGSSDIADEIPLTIQQRSVGIADEIPLTIQQGSVGIAEEIPLTIQQGSVGIAEEIPLTIQQRSSSISNESMIKLEISLSVKHASLDSVDYSAASHKIPLSIKPGNSDIADEIMSNHEILLNVKHNSLHIAEETTHEICLNAKHCSLHHENPSNVRKSSHSANQSLVASHKLHFDVNENSNNVKPAETMTYYERKDFLDRSDNVKPAETMTYYERKDFLDRSDNVKPAETMTKYEMKERLDILGIANQSEIIANFEMKNLLDDSDIEKQSEIFSLNTVSTTKESDDLVTAVENDNLLIVDTAVENNLLIVGTAVENDNLLAGITSSNTASDITYDSPETSKWNLEHSKIQDYKVHAGTLPRSQTSFVAARPSHVPLPCPPLSSFHDFQARHSDSSRSTTYPEFENVSRYWRPCQNTVSLTSLQGSHCIYRSHPLSCHEDQAVQACMCGHCRFKVDSNPTLSVTDQTYQDSISPETGLITSSLSSHLYPLPPAIMSFSFFKRSATEMAKSSKHDPANHKKEIQTANDISVRRTLELASKKLTRKDENLELASKKLTRKDESVVSKNTSRKDINLKSRHPGNFKNHSSKQKARRKAEQQKKLKVSREKDRKSKQEKRQVTSAHKHKRRTSLRLKTLAKILGKKRPNYSLVLSGYADMEEYEEEQKKKAAKSALAKARAEARAKVSMKNQEFRTDKMLTRSSAHSAVKVAVIKKTPSLKTDIVPIVKKDQSTLASIIETKRLKKEGGKDMDKEDQSIPHTSEKGEGKSHVAKPTQQKKVSPKKSTPEKSSLGLSQMPDPSLSGLVVVPIFYPTEEEFSDPIAYISSIKDKAEPFGMCRIIPPPVWKMESKLNEEIRFTTQIQHLHRLFNRWGPSVELSRAISLHLRDVIRDPNCLPQIGGVEVDLPQLYSMIRVLGGLQNIVDKKQWVRVADAMKIPKAAHDRVTRLYDIYCKYVLPYAMVTEAERQQAQKDVHDSYDLSSAEEEAILKGKSMTLSAFSRIARNVQSMWFKDDPSPELVEAAYWKIVKERDSHVAVQCAHVNTRAQATGFPTRRESPYFRHSWNLNNLPDNKKCILKCLGPVSGTTIPTLHVGMLFSTSCWSTDPHRLPYVQYLHSGANTIWYCIPKSHVSGFHKAMKELCPTLLHNDPRWLKEDIAMVKPDELMARGVNVMRCIQQPRQFVVVFPDAYTATVCCGYSVSESVHYATADWLSISVDAAKDLCASGEKEMFSVDTLVCNLCQDSSDPEILAAALPLLESIVAREVEERHELSAAGLKCERRLAVEDGPGTSSLLARKRSHDLTEDSICEVCCKICYLSMVLNEHDEQILCLEHGLRYVQRKRHTKAAKLFYRYTEEELAELVLETKDRLATLSNGSNSIKKRSLKKQDSRS